MGRLDGKVAVITGAGGWIASHTAKLFAAEGASVVCAGRGQQKIEAVVKDISAAGGKATSIVTDVTDEEQVKRMIDFAVETYGHLDILENMATRIFPGDTNVIKTPNEVWENSLKVNLWAAIWACKHAVPKMIERGGGSIMNMASMNYEYGAWEQIAYSVSKGAIVTLTKYVATTYGWRGIRANAISPGFSGNPGMEDRPGGPEILNIMSQQTLLPRLSTGMDPAYVALFLASDDSSFITGQVIRCDGGMGTPLPTAPQLRAARVVITGPKPEGGTTDNREKPS